MGVGVGVGVGAVVGIGTGVSVEVSSLIAAYGSIPGFRVFHAVGGGVELLVF